jgi:NADH dehydrogenase (ubiquinone) 1 beta subcomplex subunit 8
MWGPDVHAIGPGTALLQIGVAASLLGVFAYVIYNHNLTSPAAPRSYPYNGLEKALGGINAARAEEPEIDE